MRAALYLSGKPREEIELERSLMTGVAAFRWVTWVWMAIVLALDIRNSATFENPRLGIALVTLALAWTLTASVLVRVGPSMLLDRWALAIEFAIAAALVFCDWAVYGLGNEHSQSLGSAWPLAVILTIGIAYDAPIGFLSGVALGIIRIAGQYTFGTGIGGGDDQLAALGSTIFYALAGGVAGFVTVRLRRAEREIAIARARDEVGRTLHDGVLQTLAIVQRRSDDDELVALAREQEHELREFLFGTKASSKKWFRPATTDLAAALRETAVDIERKHHLRTQVVFTDDLAPLPDEVAAAITGAAAEALTNAAKHGHASGATIFVEPDDDGGIFCSIKDDGEGFDPATVTEGIGTTKSMRGRIEDVGGTIEIDGRPGRGAEVRIRVGR